MTDNFYNDKPFPTLNKCVIGYATQVTECKYFVPLLSYEL